MASEPVVLTSNGVKELEEKLNFLKSVRRQEIAEEIKIAREFGDLSENAEYDEAKNEQARIEGEIVTIEKMLRNASVVDEDSIDLEEVNIGAIVKLLDIDYDEEVEYQIVGSAEANLSRKRISNESPVGKALMGKKVGDVATIKTPGGEVEYRVIDIHR